jgi:hypothetical protein
VLLPAAPLDSGCPITHQLSLPRPAGLYFWLWTSNARQVRARIPQGPRDLTIGHGLGLGFEPADASRCCEAVEAVRAGGVCVITGCSVLALYHLQRHVVLIASSNVHLCMFWGSWTMCPGGFCHMRCSECGAVQACAATQALAEGGRTIPSDHLRSGLGTSALAGLVPADNELHPTSTCRGPVLVSHKLTVKESRAMARHSSCLCCTQATLAAPSSGPDPQRASCPRWHCPPTS